MDTAQKRSGGSSMRYKLESMQMKLFSCTLDVYSIRCNVKLALPCLLINKSYFSEIMNAKFFFKLQRIIIMNKMIYSQTLKANYMGIISDKIFRQLRH